MPISLITCDSSEGITDSILYDSLDHAKNDMTVKIVNFIENNEDMPRFEIRMSDFFEIYPPTNTVKNYITPAKILATNNRDNFLSWLVTRKNCIKTVIGQNTDIYRISYEIGGEFRYIEFALVMPEIITNLPF